MAHTDLLQLDFRSAMTGIVLRSHRTCVHDVLDACRDCSCTTALCCSILTFGSSAGLDTNSSPSMPLNAVRKLARSV